ncbi:MAG: type I methionyl aminopeptidase [Brevundimonas sp.]|jgi:methionyl aminopeptidase|uniref:type I methionyl aminopeptidase n=1 Tax=Brevundimonas sp. TaxID=1871086 RepID=UPI001A1DD0B3|nr:type I methionyl aminopeptidase [Brevundimonas sp.]MBJ7446616.1 type I methionyl aminopeptidase [Brevundimonas sp.]
MYETPELDEDAFVRTHEIRVHQDEEAWEGMRAAGKLVAQALDMITEFAVPGVTTQEIDDRIRTFTLDHGALPACLGYKGYEKTVCTSINHVVCHGIPGDRVLKDGDIVNIDHTVIVDGWHGDSSRMYPIGEINARARKLIDVTYDSLDAGLAMIKPGNTFGDIGYAIQQVVEANRMSVVRDFCGHGIGRLFHDSPNVLHYGRRGEGAVLKKGMFFTVEPMVNLGKPHVKVLSDGWTAVTRDKSLSSQCEHTCGVTDDGVELFSASPAGLFRPKF